MLRAPRHDLARPVRAVETMTAYGMGNLFESVERLAFRGERGEERRRLLESRIGARIPREPVHRADDVVETDGVRVEHRSAAERREAVAGQVDDVDVGGALRDPLLEDLRAFVDEREHAALDDLLGRDLARLDPRSLAVRGDQLFDRLVCDGV